MTTSTNKHLDDGIEATEEDFSFSHSAAISDYMDALLCDDEETPAETSTETRSMDTTKETTKEFPLSLALDSDDVISPQPTAEQTVLSMSPENDTVSLNRMPSHQDMEPTEFSSIQRLLDTLPPSPQEKIDTLGFNAIDTSLLPFTEDVTTSSAHRGKITSNASSLSLFEWQSIRTHQDIQVLFFKCHRMTFAVPLVALGGIRSLNECVFQQGKPNWHYGLLMEQDSTLNVVDTNKWIMHGNTQTASHQDEAYRYVVLLGRSQWALACDTLLGTETLKDHQVNWRQQAGRRPWLAGLVKEKMCVLIHVDALVASLNQEIPHTQ